MKYLGFFLCLQRTDDFGLPRTDWFRQRQIGYFKTYKNIFKEGELEPNQTVAKNATTASDGKVYDVAFYNLDVIVSVGYRMKSKNGVACKKCDR